MPRRARRSRSRSRRRISLTAEAAGPIELTKKILSEGLEEALADEATFQGLLFTTADFREGRAAFLEKRKPSFGG